MMPIKAMFGAPASAYVFEDAQVTSVFPGGSQTFNSLTNVDLTSSAATITVTLTVPASGIVWIAAGVTGRMAAAGATFLVVNDSVSGTDTDVGGFLFATATDSQEVSGDVILTGLSPGAHTFKLRVRVTASSFSLNVGHHAFIRAMAITTANVGGIIRINAGGYNVPNAISDLLDQTGGNTYSVALTKLTAGSDLYAFLTGSASNTVGNATHIIGAGNGTVDFDGFQNRSFTTSNRRQSTIGAANLTGLSAGAQTIRIRRRGSTTGNQWQNSTANRHYSSMVVAEVGPGGFNGAHKHQVPSTNVSISTGAYSSLQDGAGNPVTFSLNKQSAGSRVLVRGSVSGTGAAANQTAGLGVNVGGADYDVSAIQTDATPHKAMLGEVIISGLPAGSNTFTGRLKTNSPLGFQTQTVNSINFTVFELTA